MSWFLVLLFWNPAIQEYDVADGWYPLPYIDQSVCEERLEYIENYLSGQILVDCIQANNVKEAIATMKR